MYDIQYFICLLIPSLARESWELCIYKMLLKVIPYPEGMLFKSSEEELMLIANMVSHDHICPTHLV